MEVCINPGSLNGKIKVPASKSISHRAMIAASLSEGESIISGIDFSDDIEATLESLKTMGAKAERSNGRIKLIGFRRPILKNKIINCRESGTTMRLLIPVALLQEKEAVFCGEGRLLKRPLGPYFDIFREKGIDYTFTEDGFLKLKGALLPGAYRIPGDVSSQFISGLLFALPCLNDGSEIELSSKLQSSPYVDLTIDVLKSFGVKIINENYEKFKFKGDTKYKSCNYNVERDYSQAAFFLSAGILNGCITLEDMNVFSKQGDKVILQLLSEMGGNITVNGMTIKAETSKTTGKIIDASAYPDLVPILSVVGALSQGTTTIVNVKRLRFKESDRLSAIYRGLNSLGADIEAGENFLNIHGKRMLDGGVIDSFNDHRIAMAFSIASIRCRNKVIIRNCECVKKSYPNFYKDFRNLGGVCYEQCMGQ